MNRLFHAKLTRIKYFLVNIILFVIGFWASAAVGLFGSSENYNLINIMSLIVWTLGILYSALLRLNDAGFKGWSRLLSIAVLPIFLFNYPIAVLLLSVYKSRRSTTSF
jgi:hypothetical protein